MSTPKGRREGTSSSPPLPTEDAQLSAAARVFGIAELLEQILMYSAQKPRCSIGVLRRLNLATSTVEEDPTGHAKLVKHLFLMQKVNRTFATVIRASLSLQRAMFLSKSLADGHGMVVNPCIQIGHPQLQNFVLPKGSSSRRTIVVTLDKMAPVAKDGSFTRERTLHAVQDSSWAAMRLADKPCAAELRQRGSSGNPFSPDSVLCVMDDPTLGEIASRFRGVYHIQSKALLEQMREGKGRSLPI